jgi:Sulfotransferase domain
MRPRCFKTHLPVQFLPHQVWTVKPKLIYISRDVKDVACSLYHFRKNLLHENVESMEENFDDLLEDRVSFAPYREHVLNWKNLPNYENILHMTYEELIADIGNAIRQIGKFLNKNVTDEQVTKLEDYLSFEKMKSELRNFCENKKLNFCFCFFFSENSSTNAKHMFKVCNVIAGEERPVDEFIRKGKKGSYRDEMSEEYVVKFDEWMADGARLKQGFLV